MLTAKRITTLFLALAFSTTFLGGCSEDQGKKQDKKIETTQERLGKEAAQNLQKPIEQANKAAQLGAERVQALPEAARDTKPAPQGANATQAPTGGKEKKKLEGC